MSMGLLLEVVQNHLRTALGLAADQCRIAHEPPTAAGPLFLSVAGGGVRSEARSVLRETYELEVGVWRRAGEYPADRRGGLLAPIDPHVAGLRTLDALERQVIAALHGNFEDIPAAANAQLEPESEAVFQLALYYAGRGPTETDSGWLVRHLNFSGCTRVA